MRRIPRSLTIWEVKSEGNSDGMQRIRVHLHPAGEGRGEFVSAEDIQSEVTYFLRGEGRGEFVSIDVMQTIWGHLQPAGERRGDFVSAKDIRRIRGYLLPVR